MRVLYMLAAEAFGGAERQGLLHIRGLADLGFDVVPVVGPGQIICRALEAQGTSDYIFFENMVHEHSGPITTLGRLRRKASAFGAWLRLQDRVRRIIKQRRIDIIMANRPFAWATVSAVAHELNLPLIWRGGSRVTERQHAVGLRVLDTLWSPDLLLANCEAVRSSLAPLVRCPTALLPNGVDTLRFDPRRVTPGFRSLPGLDPAAPTIGFAGRPHPEKGLDILANVLELAVARIPDVQLIVAGDHGWREHYESHFAERGLGGRVRFLGHVDRVESFYQSCDVVILCSRQRSIEGSPNAMLEAMAMARPVVATGVGGLAETLIDGVHGFLVDDGDAPGLARHVTTLLTDPDLRRRMGAAARTRILLRHDTRSVASSLATTLCEVAGSRARGRALAPSFG